MTQIPPKEQQTQTSPPPHTSVQTTAAAASQISQKPPSDHIPVACPHLTQASGDEMLVAPHLHMACDILACDRNTHAQTRDKDVQFGQTKTRNEEESEIDSSFERLKSKHVESLSERSAGSQQSHRNHVDEHVSEVSTGAVLPQHDIPTKGPSSKARPRKDQQDTECAYPRDHARRKGTTDHNNKLPEDSEKLASQDQGDFEPSDRSITEVSELGAESQHSDTGDHYSGSRNYGTDSAIDLQAHSDRTQEKGVDSVAPSTRREVRPRSKKPAIQLPRSHGSPKMPIKQAIGKVKGVLYLYVGAS